MMAGNDVFRKVYKPLDDAQVDLIASIKARAEVLYETLTSCPVSVDPRCMAIAKTRLEDVVMWAVKAIT
jgi:hypothetical protein